ncbi:MAG: HNH endonuclease [Beijerinckiaceae bacterium]|nr:HNH endonuclease [Beijerinckiaceae bacterium]MCI0734850.1 HNH endonuclease [Beijerinckiaceae bacterium]
MARPEGAKKKLLSRFLANIGRVLDSTELRAVAGSSEWGRRIRELRDEQGYKIFTHNDRSDLKPGQYLMASADPAPAAERAISKETRARVLEIYGSVCYSCGAVAGEPHPSSGKPTALLMGHLRPKSRGGGDSLSNLRPICMICNTGASNVSAELPASTRLIAEIRKAAKAGQEAVFNWLKRKVEPDG